MSPLRATFLAAMTSGLSLLGLTVAGQTAPSGGPVGPGSLGGDLMNLALHPAVQAELRLTAEQASQLKALADRDEEQHRRWLVLVGLGRPGARTARAAKATAATPRTRSRNRPSRR